MDIFKKTLSESTGIPESLLDGETEEEAIAQAKALLAFKRSFQTEDQQGQAAARQLSTRDQFAAWIGAQMEQEQDAPVFSSGENPPVDPRADGFPLIRDGGESDYRPKTETAELFAEWFNKVF